MDLQLLQMRLGGAIIGYQNLVTALVTALQKRSMGLPRANVLVFGPPGVGKTYATKTFAHLVAEVAGQEVGYARIQGRADLMPEEFLAERISEYDAAGRPQFVYRLGAVGRFKDHKGLPGILQFDELDKTPARTQHGLLESMEEQQLSLPSGERVPLRFVLVATANTRRFDPASQPIPRATQDRFGSVVFVDYLPLEGDLEVLKMHQREWATNGLDLSVDPAILRGLVTIVKLTQRKLNGFTDWTQHVKVPAGPRGFLDLYAEAAMSALLNGQTHLSVDDIREVACRVLRGRIEVKVEAEIAGRTVEVLIGDIVAEVFDSVLVQPSTAKPKKSDEKSDGSGSDGSDGDPKSSNKEKPKDGGNGESGQAGDDGASDHPSKDGSDGAESDQASAGESSGSSAGKGDANPSGQQSHTKPTGGQGRRPTGFLGGFRNAAGMESTARPFANHPR
jgi:MoxR-like ATPase